MEKYLRLLNPKSTNFDSVGGGNFGAVTREDVILAMSYAQLTNSQDTLIKCVLGHFSVEEMGRVAKTLIKSYSLRDHHVAATDPNGLISFKVAMLELFVCPAHYQPSFRNRASLAGKSHMHVKRVLDHLIDDFKNQLEQDMKLAVDKISEQLNNKSVKR